MLVVIHLSRSEHGGLAAGVGVVGRAVWVQREPRCHRWRLWRTRAPRAVGCGDDEGFGPEGVREPRRPMPGGAAGAVGLRLPENR